MRCLHGSGGSDEPGSLKVALLEEAYDRIAAVMLDPPADWRLVIASSNNPGEAALQPCPAEAP